MSVCSLKRTLAGFLSFHSKLLCFDGNPAQLQGSLFFGHLCARLSLLFSQFTVFYLSGIAAEYESDP